MRTQWIVSVLWIAACVGVEHPVARGATRQGPSCLVTTIAGDVQGVDNGGSCAFLGVPFASPPTGALRWTPPQPAAPWSPSLFPAMTPPLSCPTLFTGAPTGSEDCLKLNLWVSDPPPTQPAPVIVWLHTGGFSAASANFASHNGRRLAETRGVIIVAPNYRHGPFGFLAHPALAGEDPAHPSSGNYGLLDQRAALQWVHDNISHFGGDPWNVTIAGTSAGAQSVGLHLVSPGSAQYFHRAIVQSAFPTLRVQTRSEAEAQGQDFAERLGCTDPTTLLACLRLKTRNEVLIAGNQAMEQVVEQPNRVHWRPIVDGLVIPDQPRTLMERHAFNQVPLIVGSNRDEGWGNYITRSFPTGVSAAQYEGWVAAEFGDDAADVLAAYPSGAYSSPMEAMARVVGEGQFTCEARRLARLAQGTGKPVFLYSYEYEIDDLSVDHVIHGVESNIIFGNPYVPPQYANHPLTPSDDALFEALSGYWTTFAAWGNPNREPSSLVRWPAFTRQDEDGAGPDLSLVLDATIRDARRPRAENCDFWEQRFLRPMTLDVPASRP
jgi:para-nitrobenzyl esterase